MDKYLVDILIEIPSGSNVKYEYDSDYRCVRCDRIMNTSLVYPTNYGFIPNTEAGDGDPLDALLISDYKLYPNTVVKARMVGVLLTDDEGGEDNKIILVPSLSVDPRYKDIEHYDQLEKNTLDKITHFFKNYKTLETKKWVNVKGYRGRDEALRIYKESLLEDLGNESDDNDVNEVDNNDTQPDTPQVNNVSSNDIPNTQNNDTLNVENEIEVVSDGDIQMIDDIDEEMKNAIIDLSNENF